jgi:hypothetical protein
MIISSFFLNMSGFFLFYKKRSVLPEGKTNEEFPLGNYSPKKEKVHWKSSF